MSSRQPFNADAIGRYIRTTFEAGVEKRMAQRASSIAQAVTAEQRRMFIHLSLHTLGLSRTPKPVDGGSLYGAVSGGSIPWAALSEAWTRRKQAASRGKFFEDTGRFKQAINSIPVEEFTGLPRSWRGRTIKSKTDLTWTISLFPALKGRYPNFRGLEKHPAFSSRGIDVNFFAAQWANQGRRNKRGKGVKTFTGVTLKRPLLQPFMFYWTKRLRDVAQRVANSRDWRDVTFNR